MCVLHFVSVYLTVCQLLKMCARCESRSRCVCMRASAPLCTASELQGKCAPPYARQDKHLAKYVDLLDADVAMLRAFEKQMLAAEVSHP